MATILRPPGNVGSLLDEWVRVSALRLRPSSLHGLRGAASHIRSSLGEIPLRDLTPQHLNDFYVGLIHSGRKDGTGGLSTRTVSFIHGVMLSALNHAMTLGYVDRNVARIAVTPKRQKHRAMKVWSAAQVRQFLEFVREDHLYAMWVVFATTGMRRGEVLGLHWQDVDLEGRRLQVQRTLICVGNNTMWSFPKTHAGYRSVVLSDRAAQILATYRRRQQRMASNSRRREHPDLVFTREDGRFVHPDRTTRRFVALSEEAGLPRIRLHDLRHTFATLALQSGVHIKVVSGLLGHATPAITMDIYSHVSPVMSEEVTQVVARLVMAPGRGRKAS
jgi:integrase